MSESDDKKRDAEEHDAEERDSDAEEEAKERDSDAEEAKERDSDAEEAAPERAVIPAFARNFPKDAELDALVAAFEQGNYARVRKEAPALAKSTRSPAVRKAARELSRRIDPDPIAVYLLAAASLLLLFLAVWYWTHPHEAP